MGLSSKGEHLKWPAWLSLCWSYGNSIWTQKFWHTGPEVLAHGQIKAWLKMNVLTEKMKAHEQELALGPEDYNNFKTWSFAMAQLHLGLSQQLADEEVTHFLQEHQKYILGCTVSTLVMLSTLASPGAFAKRVIWQSKGLLPSLAAKG